jgi:hypothetical protein
MITITINTENDAFHTDQAGEVIRLLDYIATYIQERNCTPYVLYDTNGNKCGFVKDSE